jgi:hypothetical protein
LNLFQIHLNISHWTSLQSRLLLPVESQRKNGRIGSTLSIKYQPSSPLSGIISHLTTECCGNVHDRDVVHVTASSIYQSSSCLHCLLKGTIEMTDSNYFASNHEPNSWLCYDFKIRWFVPIITQFDPAHIHVGLDINWFHGWLRHQMTTKNKQRLIDMRTIVHCYQPRDRFQSQNCASSVDIFDFARLAKHQAATVIISWLHHLRFLDTSRRVNYEEPSES